MFMGKTSKVSVKQHQIQLATKWPKGTKTSQRGLLFIVTFCLHFFVVGKLNFISIMQQLGKMAIRALFVWITDLHWLLDFTDLGVMALQIYTVPEVDRFQKKWRWKFIQPLADRFQLIEHCAKHAIVLQSLYEMLFVTIDF